MESETIWFTVALGQEVLDSGSDFLFQASIKEPDFAAQVAVCAIRHPVQGRGYEPSPLDIDEAVEHLLVPRDALVRVTGRCRSCAASQVHPHQRA